MSTEPTTSPARRAPNGTLARFVIVCAFASIAATILGLYFINSLFDETKMSRPSADTPIGGIFGVDSGVRTETLDSQLLVYFTDDGARMTPVAVPAGGARTPHQRGRAALKALLKGPEGEAMRSPVPPGTKLRGFYLLEDKERGKIEAIIDLSSDLTRKPLGGMSAEILCVYSLVNTVLANCQTADCVRITVNGRGVELLWGRLDISSPLFENPLS